jgi:hypothetical protein
VITDTQRFLDQIIASGIYSKAITESILLATLNLNYAWKIEYLSELLAQRKACEENSKISDLARINLEKIANSFDIEEDLRKLAIEKLKLNGIEIKEIIVQESKVKVEKEGIAFIYYSFVTFIGG